LCSAGICSCQFALALAEAMFCRSPYGCSVRGMLPIARDSSGSYISHRDRCRLLLIELPEALARSWERSSSRCVSRWDPATAENTAIEGIRISTLRGRLIGTRTLDHNQKPGVFGRSITLDPPSQRIPLWEMLRDAESDPLVCNVLRIFSTSEADASKRPHTAQIHPTGAI
jgi:hypothetical protein